MSEWSPPGIDRPTRIGIVVATILLAAYSVLVMQQILVVVYILAVGAAIYIGLRFLVAFEAIADAQQRIAVATERDEPNGDGED